MADDMKPPPAASPIYTQFHNTALAFIKAQAQDASYLQRMNFDLVKSVVTSDFQHTWGHNYATSMNPRLEGVYTFESFTKHLEAMLPNLESWGTTVTDVVVDEVKRKVMLRISFMMVPKGMEEGVENDMLWVLEMASENGEWKVKRSEEFIDVAAAGRLKEIMMGGKT